MRRSVEGRGRGVWDLHLTFGFVSAQPAQWLKLASLSRRTALGRLHAHVGSFVVAIQDSAARRSQQAAASASLMERQS